MKTAVSVPNEVYEQAEVLSQRTGRSRSEIHSTALREYLARHDVAVVTEAVDVVVDDIGAELDAFLPDTATRRIREVEW